MDGFDNFLPGLRVKKAAYTRVEGRGAWGLDLDAYPHTKFGVVTCGSCYIDLKDGSSPVRLERGSCYLLPRGNAFRVRATLDSQTEKFERLLNRLEGRTLRCGNEGNHTTVLGGQFIFADERYPLVLDLLPPLVSFQVNDQELQALQATLLLLEKEVVSPNLGARAMLDSLADIFFVQTLRAYLLGDHARKAGWVGILADERLGKAVRLMHMQSDKPWTLESLAAHCGMSRSVFTLQFRKKLGISPIAYLTKHRMNLAKELMLQPGDLSIAQIAAKVGYESEASFNKAFRRELSIPPATWRLKQHAKEGTG